MSAAYQDLMVRFDELQREEQWQFVVALMDRLRKQPKRSVLDFKPKRTRVAKVDAQERVSRLRKEWPK